MLIESTGNMFKVISSDNKEIYHAGTVMVSNLVLALLNRGFFQLNLCGFSDNESILALMPLIKNNINNIDNNGIVSSLTGPIERGDVTTIKKHRSMLKGMDLEIYDLLSKELLKISKVKDSKKDYKNLEEYIGE